MVGLTSRDTIFWRWWKSWSKNLYPKRFCNAGHEFHRYRRNAWDEFGDHVNSLTHHSPKRSRENAELPGFRPFFQLISSFFSPWCDLLSEWVRQFRSQAKQLGLCVLFFCFGSFLCGLIIPKTQLLGPWKRSCRFLSLRGDFFVWRGWMGGGWYTGWAPTIVLCRDPTPKNKVINLVNSKIYRLIWLGKKWGKNPSPVYREEPGRNFV